MYQFTSLARPLDFSYRSNQFIAVFSLSATAIGSGYQLAAGSSLLDSLLWGLQAGLSVFLTWAIAREIDPDYPVSAGIASLLAFGAFFILPKPALGVSFWLLIASRLLNRSTGVNPQFFDYLSFTAFSVWQAVDSSALFGFLGCTVLLLDFLLTKKSKTPVLFAGFLVVFSIIWLISSSETLQLSIPENRIIIGISSLGLLFLFVVNRSKTVTSSCDISEDLLSPLRVQTCQLFNLAAPILSLLLISDNLIWDFLPILAAVAAVSLFNLVQLIRKFLN